MELHHGQAIERIIRRNGYSITELARLTSVNRRSVYNWFNQRHLKPEIIYRIGGVINYDFSSMFPGLFLTDDFAPSENNHFNEPTTLSSTETESDLILKDKYIKLLEKHNELLLNYLNRNANVDQDQSRASQFL